MDGDRFEQLLARHFDVAATPEEMQELGALLSADHALRERFWREARFHALIRRSLARGAASAQMTGSDSADEPTSAQPAPSRPLPAALRPTTQPTGWRGIAREFVQQPLALAILLLVMISGAVLIWNLSRMPRQQQAKIVPGEPGVSAPGGVSGEPKSARPAEHSPTRPVEVQPSAVIARLTRTSRAAWGKDDASADGNELRSGQKLLLDKGLAEITFNSGVTVILEGPAEFEVGSRSSEVGKVKPVSPTSELRPPTSANSCTLKVGKLLARVPKQAHGFTVHTPTMSIVDLGTEFGVNVTAKESSPPIAGMRPPVSPATEVQVFQGEVTVALLTPLPAPASADKPLTHLKAGQAMRFEAADQAPLIIAPEPARFVRQIPPPEIAPANPNSPLQPGDILALNGLDLRLIKIDPRSGGQSLLAQGDRAKYTEWMSIALDAQGGVLIGARMLPIGGVILRFDPRTSKVEVLAVGGVLTAGRVSGLAVEPDGKILATLAAVTAIKEPKHPQKNLLVRIDPVSGQAEEIGSLQSSAWQLCLDADGRGAWAVFPGPPGEIAHITGQTVAAWLRTPALSGVRSIVVTPAGRMFVPLTQEPGIYEIDRQSRQAVPFVAWPKDEKGVLGSLATERDGDLIVSTITPSGIYRVNMRDKKFVLISQGGDLEFINALAVVPGRPTAAPVGAKP